MVVPLDLGPFKKVRSESALLNGEMRSPLLSITLCFVLPDTSSVVLHPCSQGWQGTNEVKNNDEDDDDDERRGEKRVRTKNATGL